MLKTSEHNVWCTFAFTGFLWKTIYANITFPLKMGEGVYFKGQLGDFGHLILTQRFDPRCCQIYITMVGHGQTTMVNHG